MSKEIDSNYYIPKNSKSMILVSGPARSGKSKWAEHLISKKHEIVYIATGSIQENDTNWQHRIRIHRERRPSTWRLVEASSELPTQIKALSGSESLLIDSLGGFVSAMLNSSLHNWELKLESIILAICKHQGSVILVTEETGWGVVPHTEVGILFNDRLGSLSQRFQELSAESWLVIQGRAINIGQLSIQVP